MNTAPLLRLAWQFLVAVLACTVLGTIVQTQFNLGELQRLGVPIPLDVRLTSTAADLVGFTPSFGPVVAAGFAIAFPVAAWLSARRPRWRLAWFLAAGTAAIVAALLLMELIFPVTPVAAARGPMGMAALGACGAVGGGVFRRLRRRSVG